MFYEKWSMLWDESRACVAQKLFKLYLKRYLSAPGHVRHEDFIVSGQLSEDDYAREENNKTLRAGLFLQAATGTNIPPPSTEWTITVRCPSLLPVACNI